MKKLYIYGASGHGLVIADIAKACGYEDIDFIDDGVSVYPSFNSIEDSCKESKFIIAIGNNAIRAQIHEKLISKNLAIVTLIHPSAIVSSTAMIEKGAVLMPNVVVNASAKVGQGVILNTGCIIEHECVLGDFSHISPNASLAGNVKIGARTHIGIGSSIIQGIEIGENTLIGAGSVVVKNIGNNKKAYGNPCKVIV